MPIAHQSERLVCGAGLAGHLQAVLSLDHTTEPRADKPVVVADSDADRSGHRTSIRTGDRLVVVVWPLAVCGLLRTFRGSDRELGNDGRACAGRAFNFEPSAEKSDPFAHAYEAECAFTHSRLVEPLPIVLDHRPDRRTHVGHHDAYRCGFCMLDDVRERFLDDPVQRGFVLRTEIQLRLHSQLDVHATSLGDNGPQSVERSRQTVVVESGRTQLDRQPSYVVQSRADERTNRG